MVDLISGFLLNLNFCYIICFYFNEAINNLQSKTALTMNIVYYQFVKTATVLKLI